jgi:hypothetical protein
MGERTAGVPAGSHAPYEAPVPLGAILYRRPSVNERILPGSHHRLKVDTAP